MLSSILIITEDSKYIQIPKSLSSILTTILSGGSVITSTGDFKAFWKTIAAEFVSNAKVIFDTSKTLLSKSRSRDHQLTPSPNQTMNIMTWIKLWS